IDEDHPTVRALRDAERDRRLVFLLDGLDEVPRGQRDGIHNRLATLARESRCAIVLTSRPIGFVNPGGYRELWLQPLESDRQEELVRQRHGDRGEDVWKALSEKLRHSPSLEYLAGNPLFLTLMSDLVAEGVDVPAREYAV